MVPIQELTTEQKNRLAVLIEFWYIDWKGNMTDNYVPHKLGFAKENLKQRIDEQWNSK